MKKICILFLMLLAVVSCKKWITVASPVTQLSSPTVFEDSVTANAAVAGIYNSMISNFYGLCGGVLTLQAGLQADEFQNYSTGSDQAQFYENALRPINSSLRVLWGSGFKHIYAANAVLEGLSQSKNLRLTAKQQLEGEAKFIRAFCHFFLLQYFGNIPYLDTTDYQINQQAVQLSRKLVFQKIVGDLTDAVSLLSPDYQFSSGQKVRPNQSAAIAMMARVKLYMKDWTGAEQFASQVISSGIYALDPDLNRVFLKNSMEAIWQIAPVNPQYNTWEGYEFILQGQPSSAPGQVALTNSFINSLEPGDLRRSAWMDSVVVGINTYYFPYKYKVQAGSDQQEYYMVLRLAEQYLIRAEARAMQNNLAGALEDINLIRSRAGLFTYAGTLTQDQCLNALDQERRHELFCEWGHRWFDLIRRQQAGSVLSLIKVGWKDTDTLAPIPLTELQNDPHLIQNAGY